MDISDEQLAAAVQGQAVTFQAGGTDFVILRSDVYDRVRAILYEDAPLNEAQRLAAIHAAGARADWDDPELDVYEQFRRQP